MNHDVSLSVIIVTKDDCIRLNRTLGSLVENGICCCEVLVVNGGKEVTIEEALKERLPRLRIVRDNGNGIYEAMNKGISETRKDWIWFLNCGDELADNILSETIDAEEDIGIIGFSYLKGYAKKKSLRWPELARIYLAAGFVCHQALLFRRQAIVGVGGYNEKWRFLGDKDLVIRILDEGWYIGVSPRCLVRWETEGACTRNQKAFQEEVRRYKKVTGIWHYVGGWILVKTERIASCLIRS